MRLVIQRVREASVTVEGTITGQIGPGLLVLAGCAPTDDEAALAWMVRKLVGLRIFNDDNGQMNRSVRDVGGEVLVVSQFKLHWRRTARRGRAALRALCSAGNPRTRPPGAHRHLWGRHAGAPPQRRPGDHRARFTYPGYLTNCYDD
jgi:hypothetical protein